LAAISTGAFLLLLPISHNGTLGIIDALFTSTSATCVTGLIVKDTSNDFTIFGQFVILLLIQIGGIGYMTAVTFFFVAAKQKINYRDRLALKESLSYPGMSGLVRFLKIVFASIVIIEFVGFIVLSVRFSFDMPLKEALWFGLFHSVSAFNNAGFSLFNDNLMRYSTDLTINLTIPLLIILGGLGYMVILEIYNYSKDKVSRLSTHTKIVLWMYVIIIMLGMLLLLSLEWNNALKDFAWYDKILASWFASVNYRTAGFNTIDLSKLTDSNLFFGTFFTLKGSKNVHIFHRHIPTYQINKSFAIIFVASIYIVISTIILSESEKLSFIRTLFETCSAFGTVGISTGNGGVLSYSALFSDIGKINIMLLMLMGRIGVFAFTVAIIGKVTQSRIKYAEGRIII
jgi:trk system potassium uptake protein TrkH